MKSLFEAVDMMVARLGTDSVEVRAIIEDALAVHRHDVERLVRFSRDAHTGDCLSEAHQQSSEAYFQCTAECRAAREYAIAPFADVNEECDEKPD